MPSGCCHEHTATFCNNIATHECVAPNILQHSATALQLTRARGTSRNQTDDLVTNTQNALQLTATNRHTLRHSANPTHYYWKNCSLSLSKAFHQEWSTKLYLFMCSILNRWAINYRKWSHSCMTWLILMKWNHESVKHQVVSLSQVVCLY